MTSAADGKTGNLTTLGAVGGAVVVLLAATMWLTWLNGPGPIASYSFLATQFSIGMASAVVGWLVLRQHPSHRIGRLLLVLSVLLAVSAFVSQYARRALVSAPASLPLGEVAAWVNLWVWVPSFVVFGVFVPLLFPDGSPPTRRWNWVGVAGAGGCVLVMVGRALGLDPDPSLIEVPNPYGIESVATITGTMTGVGFVVIAIALLGALFSLAVRFGRSRGVERLQLKWVLYAVGLLVGGTVLLPLAVLPFTGELNKTMGAIAETVTSVGIPIAMGIAILRYRLFDIDVVINRTLVFGSLAVFITGMYVAIVVGVGALIGTGDEPSLVLSIVATAAVAVGFQPARRRLQRLANRLVYGHRATPYELLAGFSRQVVDATGSGSQDGSGVFTQVCRLLVEGTAATSASIWREEDDRLELLSAWPADGTPPAAPPPGAVSRVITHDGQHLGILAVQRPAGEALSSQEAELLEHLSAGLGLLLVNARLTDDLRTRVAELEASRARLVDAGDEARRDLEAQLREGPQTVLASIVERLRALQEQATHASGNETPQVLAQITEVVEAASRAVSDFARGVFPPVLEHHGLDGALRAQAESAPLPVTVHTDLDGRYPREVEAALFFTASEALQNVAKYANASSAHIVVRDTGDRLLLEITDDGDGFDPDTTPPGAGTINMQERIDTHGGRLTIRSTPGHGTTITASIPHPNSPPPSTTATRTGGRRPSSATQPASS